MSGGTCLIKSFICLSFLPDANILRHHCDILFVKVMPFRYEDKHLVQHWTTCTQWVHWLVACMIQSMHICWRETFWTHIVN